MRKTVTLIGLIGLAVFLISGCCWNSKTVKDFINNPDFQKENLPIRTLSLAIATDGSFNDKEIMKCIKESSDMTEIQTGIKLEATNIVPISWKNQKSIEDMLAFLKATAKKWTFAFDKAVGFAALPKSKNDPYPAMGLTDTSDTSRFIVIRTLQSNALTHEIFHAIIMSAHHSNGGIMKSWFLESPPNEPIRDEDYYLLPEDRKIVLQNKWRLF